MTKLKRMTTCIKFTGCLCAAALFPASLVAASPVVVADKARDEFLTGYVAAILERDLLWERGSYILNIVDGVATITLFADDPVRRDTVDKQLRTIDGLRRVVITVQPTDARKPGAVNKFLGITGQVEAFPVGDPFQPIIADLKQPQFFVSLNSFRSVGEQYTMASVGFGETFGMFKFLGNREGDGLQLSLEGAIFAQFNMNTPSSNLINADYTVGIPVTYRRGDNSFRLRTYHQSSHLGDELLLSVGAPKRVNLSYEAMEFIYSRDWREWRVYGGGEYLFHKEPADVHSKSAHWGIEYRGSNPLFWNGRPIAGVDMKKIEEHDWSIDTSVKAGLEFGHPNSGHRRLRLLAEYYKGLDPHGQFYKNKVESFSLGLSLGY